MSQCVFIQTKPDLQKGYVLHTPTYVALQTEISSMTTSVSGSGVNSLDSQRKNAIKLT